ncbi:MAG: alcohol dehydrogenase catalytic domain-containing protein, partial [Microbacterium sp.]
MRAVVLREIGALEVQERPAPTPESAEVLIRVAATGICGSDVHGYTGENGRRFPGQIMGHESVGYIESVGADVDPAAFPTGAVVTFNPVVVPAADVAEFAGREQHHPGKIVIGVAPDRQAAFADYVAVPARNVVLLPEGMPVVYGALVEPLAVAVHAVRRALADGDRRALVIGGGPIGQSVVLALRMHGVTAIALSEPDAGRRALCERLGARTIDPLAGP